MWKPGDWSVPSRCSMASCSSGSRRRTTPWSRQYCLGSVPGLDSHSGSRRRPLYVGTVRLGLFVFSDVCVTDAAVGSSSRRGRGGGARRGRCAVVDAEAAGHGRDPGENLLRGFADPPARATHPDAGDQRRRPSLPSRRVRPTAMQLMLGQPEREPGAGRVGCATAAYSRGHRDDVTPRPGRTRARGEECRTEASNRKCNPQRSLHEFFQLFGIDNISRCG